MTYYEGVYPLKFIDDKTSKVDWSGFREDLRLRLANDHIGAVNGISTKDLAQIYLGRIDLEATLCIENQLQIVRKEMMKWESPVILKSTFSKWHIAGSAQESFDYLADRTMRIVRAHGQTQKAARIATQTYPELANSSTVQALQGMTKTMNKLEKAVGKDKLQLESPQEEAKTDS